MCKLYRLRADQQSTDHVLVDIEKDGNTIFWTDQSFSRMIVDRFPKDTRAAQIYLLNILCFTKKRPSKLSERRCSGDPE
jgi:hypothetical protein